MRSRWFLIGFRVLLCCGALSLGFVAVTDVLCDTAPDEYEPDDAPASANPYYVGGESQVHTIHSVADQDWVYIEILPDGIYEIRLRNVGSDLDLGFDIYSDTDTVTPLISIDAGLAGEDETYVLNALSWSLPQGKCYVRVWMYGAVAPVNPGYTLEIVQPTGANNGLASAYSACEIDVYWTPSGSAGIVGYEIRRSSFAKGPYVEISEVSALTSSYRDGCCLEGATTYWYLIYSINSDGKRGQFTTPFSAATAGGDTCTPTVPSGQTPTDTPTETPTGIGGTPTDTPTRTPTPTHSSGVSSWDNYE